VSRNMRDRECIGSTVRIPWSQNVEIAAAAVVDAELGLAYGTCDSVCIRGNLTDNSALLVAGATPYCHSRNLTDISVR
jgi:hypothetical protein